jgi:tetratricopeptide (TPR) repeat protein
MSSGETLRILLERAQLPLEQLAHKLDQLARQLGLSSRIDRKTPYKWLRGTVPRRPWPALVSAVLSQRLSIRVEPRDIWQVTDGELVFVPANTGLEVPWTGAGTITAAFEVAESSMIDRRVFLQLTGAALTQHAFDWLLAQPAADVLGSMGRRVTDAHVDSIDAITSQLRHMDDQFGGGAVLDLVKSQVRFVLDLLRDHSYTSTVGARLHGAAAELLRLAGWACFDASQHAQAQRFWITALHAAHSAGDRSLGANILGFMSCQARDLELRSEAVRLADAARQGYPGASPRVSAMLNLRAARAYARANEPVQCQAAIDAAYDAFQNQNADSTSPEWMYWFDEAQANEHISYCYARLGNWQKAQAHMVTALRLTDDRFVRERAVRHIYLSTVYVRQGEPEHACELATRAADVLSHEVDSARAIGHLQDARDALSPYRKLPAVREFRAKSQELFHTTNGR